MNVVSATRYMVGESLGEAMLVQSLQRLLALTQFPGPEEIEMIRALSYYVRPWPRTVEQLCSFSSASSSEPKRGQTWRDTRHTEGELHNVSLLQGDWWTYVVRVVHGVKIQCTFGACVWLRTIPPHAQPCPCPVLCTRALSVMVVR